MLDSPDFTIFCYTDISLRNEFLLFADVLLSEIIPRVLCQVRNFLSGTANVTVNETFEFKPGFRFWSKLIEEIKDSYAMERMSEQLLHQLAAQNTSDIEAYWILWILFHRSYEKQPLIRFAISFFLGSTLG